MGSGMGSGVPTPLLLLLLSVLHPIIGKVPAPLLVLERREQAGIRLRCLSERPFPEIRLLWSGAKGENLTGAAEPAGAGISLLLRPGLGNAASCRALDPQRGAAAESSVVIADVFFPSPSPWVAALALLLLLALCLALAAAFRLRRNNRILAQERKSQEQLQEEIEELRMELEEETGKFQRESRDTAATIERIRAQLDFRRAQSHAVSLTLDERCHHPSVAIQGRSLLAAAPGSGRCRALAVAREGFSCGKHYWEVELGRGHSWELGVLAEEIRDCLRHSWGNSQRDSLQHSLNESPQGSQHDSQGDSLQHSLQDPPQDPPPNSQLDPPQDSLQDSLRHSLHDSLQDPLQNSQLDPLQHSQLDFLHNSLNESPQGSQHDSLQDPPPNSQLDPPQDSLQDSLRHSLHDSLQDPLQHSLQDPLQHSQLDFLHNSLNESPQGSQHDSLQDPPPNSQQDPPPGSQLDPPQDPPPNSQPDPPPGSPPATPEAKAPGLRCSRGEFRLPGGKLQSSSGRCRVLGVLLDQERRLLSFFDAEEKQRLGSVPLRVPGNLFPFFGPGCVGNALGVRPAGV